ncbi:Protein DBF4-like B [Acipenser ruthenus]|uniref:Protein DBF4-like B n=1 Tax=Acipenser ruthenus TaxID=7906 RepID=A0A444UBM7_ACIRT|nr:Protein DBF4-like B [Acipenser ruthenus]
MQRRARVQELEAGLAPGRRPFQGKSFYLDLLQSKHAPRVVEAIRRMGGTIESFLSKEVSYLVSRSQEARQGGITKATKGQSVQEARQGGITKETEGQSVQEARQGGIAKATKGQSVQEARQGGIAKATKGQSVQEARQGGITSSPSPPLTSRKGNQRPASTTQSSRGKALLEKAMCSTVQTVTASPPSVLQKKPAAATPLARVVKAGTLKQPFLKIEDCSRRYKPLHLQLACLPQLDFSRVTRCSPFEPPAPLQPGTEEDQLKRTVKPFHSRRESRGLTSSDGEREKQGAAATPPLPVTPVDRKRQGFCECCQQAFQEQNEHLQSEQHRVFVQNTSHYSAVDRLISQLQCHFVELPAQHSSLLRCVSPPVRSPEVSLDLPQNNSEVEKAIEALLCQGEPSTQGRGRGDCILNATPPQQRGEGDCILNATPPQQRGEGDCILNTPPQQSGEGDCILNATAPQQRGEGDCILNTPPQQSGEGDCILNTPPQQRGEGDCILNTPPQQSGEGDCILNTPPQQRRERDCILNTPPQQRGGVTSLAGTPCGPVNAANEPVLRPLYRPLSQEGGKEQDRVTVGLKHRNLSQGAPQDTSPKPGHCLPRTASLAPRNSKKRPRSSSTSPVGRKRRRVAAECSSDPSFNRLSYSQPGRTAGPRAQSGEAGALLRAETPGLLPQREHLKPAGTPGIQPSASGAPDVGRLLQEPASECLHKGFSKPAPPPFPVPSAPDSQPLAAAETPPSEPMRAEQGQLSTPRGYHNVNVAGWVGGPFPPPFEPTAQQAMGWPGGFLPLSGPDHLPAPMNFRPSLPGQCFAPVLPPVCPVNQPPELPPAWPIYPPVPEHSSAMSQSFSSLHVDTSLLPPGSFSSESDWDCDLLSRLEGPPAARGQCDVDMEVLRQACATVQDSGYESRLCSVLRQSELDWAAGLRCANETEPIPFGGLEAWPV